MSNSKVKTIPGGRGQPKSNGRSVSSIAKQVNKEEGRHYNLKPSAIAFCISQALYLWAKEAAEDRKLIEGYSK